MKIRQGFVSNSSSSSFIVAFKDIPTSREELQKMLFGDADIHSKYDYSFPTSELAEQVWIDLRKALRTPLSIIDVSEKVGLGSVINSPFPEPEWKYSEDETEIQQRNQEFERFADATAVWFSNKAEGAAIVEFEYGDESNFGCVLEHGETFENLPHLQISHH